jgi:hypothetical protein
MTNSLFMYLGAPFTKSIGLYLQKGFQKGVPSLFQSVKYLYATPEKVSCYRLTKKNRIPFQCYI